MSRTSSFLLLLIFIAAFGCGGGSGDGNDTREDIAANEAPVANFSVSTERGFAPLTVSFDASASTDSDGTITGYAWTFGDGGTGSGFQVAYTYKNPGLYTALLTVTDNGGLTGTHSLVIVVHTSDAVLPTHTISGTVTSAKNMTSDSDVNDINAIPVSNDTFEDAQKITAPTTISGYVNVPGAGPPGASFLRGDRDDYYRVALTGGMTIALNMVEDAGSAELSLYLYDSQQDMKDMTVTDSETGIASLSVPEDEIYFVHVQASDAFFQTATGYALTLGLAKSTTAGPALRLSDDFVPGEVIVRFSRDFVGTDTQSVNHTARLAAMGFEAKAGMDIRDKLFRQSDAVGRKALFSRLGVEAAVERSMTPGNLDSKTAAKLETLWMIRAMRRLAGIELVEPNYIRKTFLTPTDPYYNHQWHYPFINLPDAWDVTTGDRDVVVAVVDTGVLLSHPDLKDQLVDGYDFIKDEETAMDDDGIDDDPNDPGDAGSIGGSSFHGTHVAGTIAAETDNRRGVAGVAWNTRIMPMRVLGKDGEGTTYDMMQAVKYAAGLENDSGILLEEPVDIINMSYGGEGYSYLEAEAFAKARDQGVILIAAAGNYGSIKRLYPAAYDGVVSVSAVAIDETLADYSNYGPTIDVAAPGGSSTDTNGDGYPDGVLSTTGNDSDETVTMEYAFYEGTSMATPHVSGVAALMKSLYPDLTPVEFDTLLQAGYLTRDLGETGWDEQFGWGLIDAHKAVLMAREGNVNGGIPAILSASPGNLNFGADPSWADPSTADVTLQNGGGGDLSVTDVYASDTWLSVLASPDVDDAGLGTYRITATRSGLSDGLYTGTVTFESSTNTVSIPVVMLVGTLAETTGGYHYILLLDPETSDPIAQVGTAGTDGVYEYSFSNLSEGNTYTIYAGTDPDNDFYICGEGEACGAYISLDEPVVLTVAGDMANIDFTTNINMSLPGNAAGQVAAQGPPLQRHWMREILE